MAEATESKTRSARFEERHGSDRSFLAWVTYLVFRVALAILVRLPWRVVDAFIGLVARLARRVDRRHSDAARKFLRIAEPDLTDARLEERVLEAYRHFFRVVIESQRLLVHVPIERQREHFEYEFVGNAREVMERGEGVVMVSGHLGNWEAGAVAVRALGWHEFHGVAKPVKNHFISRFVFEQRQEQGVRILPRRGAMTEAPAILKGGGALGLLLDQRARVKPVMAPFFGRPARSDRSAGVLIRRLSAPVVLCATFRTERPTHFRFRVGPVITAEEVTGLDPLEVSTRINAELESMIREAPEQYFWLHDRYRDAPEPEPESSDAADD